MVYWSLSRHGSMQAVNYSVVEVMKWAARLLMTLRKGTKRQRHAVRIRSSYV